MNLTDVLDAGRVLRYHASAIDKKQTVGEHTYGVLTILLHIHPTASRRLLIHAIFHDVAEVYTGDIPSPVKQMHPDVKEKFDELERNVVARMGIDLPKINDEERRWLKIADLLEGALYCESRLKAGDQNAIPVLTRYVKYLADLDFDYKEFKQWL